MKQSNKNQLAIKKDNQVVLVFEVTEMPTSSAILKNNLHFD